MSISGSWYGQATSPLPFLVTVSKRTVVLVDPKGVESEYVDYPGGPYGRKYFLWFFGYIALSNVHVVKAEDIVYQ